MEGFFLDLAHWILDLVQLGVLSFVRKPTRVEPGPRNYVGKQLSLGHPP